MGGLSLGGSGRSGVLSESQGGAGVKIQDGSSGSGVTAEGQGEAGGWTDQGVLAYLESQLMVTEVQGPQEKPTGEAARAKPAGQEA